MDGRQDGWGGRRGCVFVPESKGEERYKVTLELCARTLGEWPASWTGLRFPILSVLSRADGRPATPSVVDTTHSRSGEEDLRTYHSPFRGDQPICEAANLARKCHRLHRLCNVGWRCRTSCGGCSRLQDHSNMRREGVSEFA